MEMPSRPPRPKSTLGLSSAFALSWKPSLASSTRSTHKLGPTETKGPTSASRPATPFPQIGRGLRGSAEATTVEGDPLPGRLHHRTQQITPVTPRKGSNVLDTTRSRAETPKTKAIHDTWRAEAQLLEGLAKQCLQGAVCIRVTDPLEDIRGESSGFRRGWMIDGERVPSGSAVRVSELIKARCMPCHAFSQQDVPSSACLLDCQPDSARPRVQSDRCLEAR